jgi:hypothetical protein
VGAALRKARQAYQERGPSTSTRRQ